MKPYHSKLGALLPSLLHITGVMFCPPQVSTADPTIDMHTPPLLLPELLHESSTVLSCNESPITCKS